MKNKVYAVNVNVDRMLDVARETYQENVDDILELKAQLSQEYGIPLSLEYQERGGGFWFTVVKDHLEGELPRGFLNVTTKGAKWCFTSMELVSHMGSLRAPRPDRHSTEEEECKDERCARRSSLA